MSTLAAFLLARVADDEETAKAATPGPWEADENYPDSFVINSWATPRPDPDDWDRFALRNIANESSRGDIRTEDAHHIARWDPARVLAECAAKRALIRSAFEHEATLDDEHSCGHDIWTLRLLAQPYVSHPDFRPEWATNAQEDDRSTDEPNL